MSKARRTLFVVAIVFASTLLVMGLRPGAQGQENAAGPVLLLARLRRNCKLPVPY